MAADKEPAKPAKLSANLMKLKFMQRTTEKQVLKEAESEEEAKKDESEWVTPPTTARRCVIISERDPLPSATIGRMSFQQFNPSIEKLQTELDGGTVPKEPPPADVDVTEQQMTEALVPKQQRKGHEVPWRERVPKRPRTQ